MKRKSFFPLYYFFGRFDWNYTPWCMCKSDFLLFRFISYPNRNYFYILPALNFHGIFIFCLAYGWVFASEVTFVVKFAFLYKRMEFFSTWLVDGRPPLSFIWKATRACVNSTTICILVSIFAASRAAEIIVKLHAGKSVKVIDVTAISRLALATLMSCR